MRPEEFYDLVIRELMHVIETRSKENDFRYEYWQLMSERRWMNEPFKLLSDTTIAYMEEELPKFNERTPLNEVLAEVVDEWVTMDLSAWVLSVPEYERSLPTDIYNITRDLADRRERFLTSRERSRPAPSRFNGRGPAGRYDERPQSPRANARSAGNRGGGGLFRDEADTDTNHRSGRRVGGLAAVPTARRPVAQEEETVQRPVQRELRGQDTDEFVAPSTTHSRGARPRTPTATELDGPDYTKSRPYDQFFLEGEEWQLAHKSKWTLTWDASNPFPRAFNPRTHMRFYVRAHDGTIREEHLAMNDGMRYASHEYQGRVDRGQVVNRPLYERSHNSEGYAAVEEEEGPAESPAVVRVSRATLEEVYPLALSQSSREEAEINAEFERRKQKKPAGVFHYVRAFPINVDPDKSRVLDTIIECTNLTHAAEVLNNTMEVADLGLWNFLNDRFTTAVNHVVSKRFGLKATISDFANDYQALLNWMKDKQGESFARQFSQNTRYLTSLCASKLTPDAARDYITDILGISEEEYDAAPPPIMVFEDLYSLMVVPFSSHELGIKLTDDSQMVGDEAPHLQELLKKFCEMSHAKMSAACCYIFTTDRLRIEVLQGGIDQTTYLVRKLG